MIGSCDCCDRTNVPISRCEAYGIETYACFICQGDTDPDPYCEMEPCKNNGPWVDAAGECLRCGAVQGEACR